MVQKNYLRMVLLSIQQQAEFKRLWKIMKNDFHKKNMYGFQRNDTRLWPEIHSRRYTDQKKRCDVILCFLFL